jgi:hypothetical protein
MTEWFLNNQPLADLGITLSSGTKTTHGPSSVNLKRACNHDAVPLLSYGDAAVLSYKIDDGDVVVFFRGKCMTVPRYGDAGGEGQSYEILDAWAELETTIYQESWGYGELDEEAEEIGRAHV